MYRLSKDYKRLQRQHRVKHKIYIYYYYFFFIYIGLVIYHYNRIDLGERARKNFDTKFSIVIISRHCEPDHNYFYIFFFRLRTIIYIYNIYKSAEKRYNTRVRARVVSVCHRERLQQQNAKL